MADAHPISILDFFDQTGKRCSRQNPAVETYYCCFRCPQTVDNSESRADRRSRGRKNNRIGNLLRTRKFYFRRKQIPALIRSILSRLLDPNQDLGP